MGADFGHGKDILSIFCHGVRLFHHGRDEAIQAIPVIDNEKEPFKEMEKVIYLSLVTASISFTVSESKLFTPLREWAKKRIPRLGELLSCGYCLGHWISFALVAVYRPRLFDSWWLLDYFLTASVIAWLSGAQWVVMCWLMDKAGK